MSQWQVSMKRATTKKGLQLLLSLPPMSIATTRGKIRCPLTIVQLQDEVAPEAMFCSACVDTVKSLFLASLADYKPRKKGLSGGNPVLLEVRQE